MNFFDWYAAAHPFAFYLSGSILLFMIGIAVGNYATSLVYRLPRGLKIANDDPYCECEKRIYLAPRDLFPVFSWLLSKGKCRYCDTVKVPATYTVIEFLCGALFVGMWMIHGMGEKLLLIYALDVFLITIASIYFLHQRFFPILFITLVGIAATYRTLLDGTVFGFAYAAYWAMMLGVVVWQLECVFAKKKLPYPDYATILAIGGLCVGMDGLVAYLVLSVVMSGLCYCLKCLHSNFAASAWVLGVCGAVLIMLGIA
jgi:leader peptidase (prepilin peptidase)/N-methyltransferase